jgi:hypothetical protein
MLDFACRLEYGGSILQINYKLSSSLSTFMKEADSVADAVAAVTGLRWKIWLVNESEQEGGEIYLFDVIACAASPAG